MLNQNQFSITTLKGTLDSGNSITCQFHSVVAGDVVTPGEFVCLSSALASAAPAVSVVEKGVDKASKYLGMVLTNPLKSAWLVSEKLEVAILGTIAMVEVAGAVPAGSSLAYDPATKRVGVAAQGDTVVGLAMETASSAGQLIRGLVQTKF
jgi:hypothetical protein